MKKVLLIATVAFSAATPALADRAPTPGERSSIVRVLHANGFVAWSEIERDDGKWEVDGARHRNGGVYDLDIRGGRIVKRERD